MPGHTRPRASLATVLPDAAAQRSRLAHARAQAAADRAAELQERTERVLAETQALQRTLAHARQRRSRLAGQAQPQRSDYERLLAQLETMPVIEQAKGVIMAQSRCGEAEAFEMLRRASQRSNVPVRDLAARIVANAAGAAPPAGTAAPAPDPGTSRA